MKSASGAFKSALAEGVTTLCRLWRVTPRGRSTLYFTDHDRDLTVGGNTYQSTESFQASAIQNSIGGSRANMEITVMLGDVVSRDDAARGIFDSAVVEVDLVFYDNISRGTMLLFAGEVNGISVPFENMAIFSCNSRARLAQRPLAEQYTPTCRADFCDARCGLNAADFTTSFTVSSASSRIEFSASGISGDDYKLGAVKWTTGDNAGTAVEVMGGSGSVRLALRTPYPIKPGDTGTITKGCDKTVEQCEAYNNLINFRGEPYVPGADFVIAPVAAEVPPEVPQPTMTWPPPDWMP